jgi:putative exporter of polyketide antibiotics
MPPDDLAITRMLTNVLLAAALIALGYAGLRRRDID